MSIIDKNMGINPINEAGKKLEGEALSRAQQEMKNLIDKQTAELQKKAGEAIEKVNEVKGKINDLQSKATQAQDTLNKLTQAPKVQYNIPEGIVESKLPPGVTIPNQLPQLDNIISYGKTYGQGTVVYAKVLIDGEEYSKTHHIPVTITQRMADHDTFKLEIPSEAFSENNEYPFINSKKHLGGRVTIEMIQFGETRYLFTGIITEITSRRENANTKLIFTGHAPTILLENGQDCQSYENMDLAEIIKKATEEYQGEELINFDIRNENPSDFPADPKIGYTVQYKESDFAFIRRLAQRYGKWFYYDGQDIVFGGIGGKTVEMLERKDLYNYDLSMKTIPQKFTYLSYESKAANELTVGSDQVSVDEPGNPFTLSAVKASEKLYSKIPTTLFNQSLLEQNAQAEVEQAVKRQKEHRRNTVNLEASSNNPNVRLGDIAKLRSWTPQNPVFQTEGLPIESYIITEIEHNYSAGQGYTNKFKAVPRYNKVPNYMDEDAFPKCEEQSATVVDNNDPMGQSRIRVQFQWQKLKNEKSPWLRVVTPYAGNGKGMHVLPEIAEEVMVTFENGNAEKPVVLGTMFNGKGKSGHGGAGNYMKGLTTAAGSNLTFNDQTGSMNLADQPGSVSMSFDGAGNAIINSSENIVFVCGKSKIVMNKDGGILVNGEDIGVLAKTSIGIGVGEGEKTTSGIGIEAATLDVGTKTLTMSGETEANLGAPTINIGGEGETNIVSGKVKLN